MKLYATVNAPDGKEAGKSSNEMLTIRLYNDKREVFGSLAIFPYGTVIGSIHGNKIDILNPAQKNK